MRGEAGAMVTLAVRAARPEAKEAVTAAEAAMPEAVEAVPRAAAEEG
jgi:hypothetical protein